MSRTLLTRVTVLTVGASFLLASAVRAQAPAAAPAAAAPGIGNIDISAGLPTLPPNSLALRPKVSMTLRQAVQLGLEKNFGVQTQRLSLLNSQESLIQAKASFDPSLSASTNRSGSKSTSATTGRVTYSPISWSTSFGVSQSLPTGGSVSVSMTPFNRSGAPASFSTGLNFSFSHNLLRGFGRDIGLAGIRNAQLSLDSANLTWKGLVLDTVQSIENAYTVLIAANDTLDVRLRSEQISQAQLRESTIRKQAGLITDIELSTTRQSLLSASLSRIQAENSVKAAEDTLRNLLGPAATNTWDIAIDTADVEELNFPTPTVEAAYKLTLANSTDYQSRLISIRQSEISLISTRSNTLPSLNLSTSFGATGRDDSIHQSWTQVRGRENTSWSVGLSFSMAWGLHSEKSRLRAALNSLESSRISLNQLEQSILIQVRTAVRNLDTARTSLTLSDVGYKLAQQNYDADNERYKVGNQTQLALLQRQQSLEAAGVSLTQAKFSLRSAITALQRLEGTTLDRYGIAVPSATK